MHLQTLSRVVALGLFAAGGGLARAENVDLSTVPDRQSVQLTIYNSEDLTLVRETRKVSFKKGVNPLEFSWANTLIDPTSVRLRFLTHPELLDVLDTTFPLARPQTLYWNVQSELDGEATIEISYFTSGISWSADYLAVSNREETEMKLEGFVRVSNNSGEEYEDAQVRLVVGRINLVEKIARLAQPTQSFERKLSDRSAGEKEEGMILALEKFDAGKDLDAGFALGARGAPKQIVKEGLSEYFIYTIEGTETIHSGWSKRMRSFEGTTVPLKIQYRYREPEYGPRLVRMYLLANDKASNLGTTPLPDGTVRVFRQSGREGLSYLASQAIKYVPIGDKIELNLGPDPEVIFDLVPRRAWRDAIWMKVQGLEVFRRVDAPGVEIDAASTVAGWDEHTLYDQRVRNYSAKPIDVEVRRTLPGDVVFRSNLEAASHDYQTVEYRAAVEAGQKADLAYELVRRQGRNAKQNHLTVEKHD
jgi:hypothetical protein